MANENYNQELVLTTADEGKVITVLNGKAPTQWGQVPLMVYKGDINAPTQYAKRLHDDYINGPAQDSRYNSPTMNAIASVSVSEARIFFIANKHAELREEIIGSAKVSRYLDEVMTVFKINDPNCVFTPAELRSAIRRSKMYFAEAHDYQDALAKLEDVSAKITSEMQIKDDGRGNKTSNFEQTLKVSQNAPQRITLTLPLVENEEDWNVVIELVPDVLNTRLVFRCECWDLQKNIADAVFSVVSREVKALEALGYLVLQLL